MNYPYFMIINELFWWKSDFHASPNPQCERNSFINCWLPGLGYVPGACCKILRKMEKLGLSPCPVTVTTRSIVFSEGDPELNLQLPLLLGEGTTQGKNTFFFNPSHQKCWRFTPPCSIRSIGAPAKRAAIKARFSSWFSIIRREKTPGMVLSNLVNHGIKPCK